MRAFWGAFVGWAVGQVVLVLLLWWLGGENSFADKLAFSLTVGGFGACLGACTTAGRDVVPAFGCLTYLVCWGGLVGAALYSSSVLGLPGLLVPIVAIVGVLTGFWLMGDGPLSPVLLLVLWLVGSVYGVLSLFTPPPIFSVRNLGATLGLLAGFQVAHVVLARLLRGGRRRR